MIVGRKVLTRSLRGTRSDRIVPTPWGISSALCLHSHWRWKSGASSGTPPIEREAAGPAQEGNPHGLTER